MARVKIETEIHILDGEYCDCYEESCIFLANHGAEGVTDNCIALRGAIIEKGYGNGERFVKHRDCPNPCKEEDVEGVEIILDGEQYYVSVFIFNEIFNLVTEE